MENYSTEFKIKIGNAVLKKQRIYLDTKYWVFMRDAALGQATPEQFKIYEILKDRVAKDIAICPLSYHVFIELMHIGDEQKRIHTAQVMDELSQQVCFIPPIDIVGQELLCFVRYLQTKAEEKQIFNPTKYVFTKIPFVMGEMYPTVKGLPDETMNDIRKQFYEYFSKFTLVEILKTAKGEFPQMSRSSLIAQLNIGKDDNQDWTTFHDVFLQEISGILDVVKDDIEELWKLLYAHDKGCCATPDEIRQSDCVKLLSNAIYNAFAHKTVSKELPFFHINASLHAYLRYNKTQRFKENDLPDFSHAAWALPYCNLFLTEKRLSRWISNSLLGLDKIYGTTVLSEENDVLNALISS